MSRKTIVETFLHKLSEELHIEALIKNEQINSYSLKLGMHSLQIDELSVGYSLWIPFADVPEGDKEDLYILLMQANFLGQGTGDAAIGIDQDEKSLTLSLSIPYEVKYETFKEHIEDFLNYVEYWREQIEGFKRRSLNF